MLVSGAVDQAHFESRTIQDCIHRRVATASLETLLGRCQFNKVIHRVLQGTFGLEAKVDSSPLGVGMAAHIVDHIFLL
jgi:hypothetical protein